MIQVDEEELARFAEGDTTLKSPNQLVFEILKSYLAKISARLFPGQLEYYDSIFSEMDLGELLNFKVENAFRDKIALS